MAVQYSYLPYHTSHLIQQADEDVNTSETLFNTLYDLTPESLLPQPSLADALAGKPTISKQRDFIAFLVETADIDYEDFYKHYKQARAGELWMKDLKVKKAGKKMFREAWANEIRTNSLFWGDVTIIAVWTGATKIMVNVVDKALHFIYRIAPTEGDHKPEIDNNEEWQCVYIMLEKPTSCTLHLCDITDADGKVLYKGAVFPHKGHTEEWDQLMKRLQHDQWSLHEVDSTMKQAAEASRLSISPVESGVSAIKKKAPIKEVVATSTSDETIKNPHTGRKVKIGSKTYLALVKAGTIQAV